jgi:hypothetical protein
VGFFSPIFWFFFSSLGCLVRFFYRVFGRFVASNKGINAIKKIAQKSPQLPKKQLLTCVTFFFFFRGAPCFLFAWCAASFN